MTKVINFIAGPSAGKSTLAALLFGHMKVKGMSCELVTEYPNDLVNRGHFRGLDDQLAILGEQHQRMYCLKDKVEYIITDSPLILQLYYAPINLKKYKDSGFHDDICYSIFNLVNYLYNAYENELFFVDRTLQGREKIEDYPDIPENAYKGSVADKKIKEILGRYAFSYDTVSNIDEVLRKLWPKAS